MKAPIRRALLAAAIPMVFVLGWPAALAETPDEKVARLEVELKRARYANYLAYLKYTHFQLAFIGKKSSEILDDWSEAYCGHIWQTWDRICFDARAPLAGTAKKGAAPDALDARASKFSGALNESCRRLSGACFCHPRDPQCSCL